MKINKIIGIALCLISITQSCQKVDIKFGESVLEADPNITVLDNYKVDIETYKVDSFRTSANQILSAGYHYDSVFGVVKAGAYTQLTLPSTNPVLNETLALTMDSLELIVRPTGSFYGDSSKPVKLNVYRLTQNIVDAAYNADAYYNTNSFAYDPTPIGQQTISLYGKSGTDVHIKLSNALGQELLTKFKDNNDDISTEEKFINYFKGIYITTDSVITNSIAYFSAPSDSVFMRLNFHDNGLYPQQRHIDFYYTKTKQFNNINFRYTNADFASFVNKKAQLIPSASSGNKAYLNTNLGSYIKLSFPTILNLKELHPYIKVVKAELIIKPNPTSYSYPYKLPGILNLYTTDENNYVISPLYYPSSTEAIAQTGNLAIDYLYGQNTNYSYDISTYINALIAEGQFTKSALLLYPTVSAFDTDLQRLVLNDQTSSQSVQLKLYVLGL